MKHLAMISIVAAALMAGAGGVLAQDNTPKQPNSNSGTSPAEMGATGWTGGTRGQTHDSATGTGQANSGTNSEAAKDQPVMATGEDLKGPPAQFPANKTPE
jgi:hypothetical protein